MDGSRCATGSPPPQEAAPDLAAAESIVLGWDPAADADKMLFDGPDRADADRYLAAVDQIRRSLGSSPAAASPRRSSSASPVSNTIQIAMARLEDEFRHILLTRASDIEVESLVDLNSLSLSFSSAAAAADDDYSESDSDLAGAGGGGGAAGAAGAQILAAQESIVKRSHHARTGSGSNNNHTSSIHEIELLPPTAINDLRSIAEQMVAAGYGRECVQVYSTVRKSVVDHCFRQLGVERLSIGDVQRLEWDVLESKIRRWIRAARGCIRIVFASERRLCELIFDGISDDAPFTETVKGAAIQLLSFAEAISIGRRSPEKLFKILDLHDAISDLLPDVAAVFRSKSSESIYTQAAEILTRLTEAVRGIISEFENAVLREPSKIPVPGGTIHPLTRYVMNYISLISDYRQTLTELIVAKPSASSRFSGDDPVIGPEIEFPESENQSPLASHLIWIIVILQSNLENKANLYKDNALSHLFLMNNVHYIVHKVKGSPELREMIGDDFLRRQTGKFRRSATGYERATWGSVLHCLRDEGIHVSGSFSSGISKSTLRERFRSFNAAFDEVHRLQGTWFVPDVQLREELRISISEKLLPAYRSFLGRFRQHIESGRHPEMYIKYSVEDLEIAMSDFFEGCPPTLHSRRRSLGR